LGLTGKPEPLFAIVSRVDGKGFSGEGIPKKSLFVEMQTGDLNDEVLAVVHRSWELRQVSRGRSAQDGTLFAEVGAMAAAGEGAVGKRSKRAITMRAIGGKGGQVAIFPYQEKALVPEVVVDAVGGVKGCRASVNDLGDGPRSSVATALPGAARASSGRQENELSAIHVHCVVLT